MKPKLAIPNIFSDIKELKEFALENGFSGIDWSFDPKELPETPGEMTKWTKGVSSLEPLEVRYHCPFHQVDLGDDDLEKAKAATILFQRIIRLVSGVGGRYLTIHIGLGRDSTGPLSWWETIVNLRRLVQYGEDHQVKICLENLAWGWTSRPNLFEKIIRKSGAAVTFDIGHAWVCEAVRTQAYAIEDFVIPHPDRVLNAHIYHSEVSGLGHIPPENLESVEQRFSLLLEIGCKWWIIEVKKVDGLLQTKHIVDEYLTESNRRDMANAMVL
ncbi:MAG: TIM barrel protein [Thermodesulfobacteriota bacterium]|nr:TIM barrel protein [Thermodesulfobacteriota bacterium]